MSMMMMNLDDEFQNMSLAAAARVLGSSLFADDDDDDDDGDDDKDDEDDALSSLSRVHLDVVEGLSTQRIFTRKERINDLNLNKNKFNHRSDVADITPLLFIGSASIEITLDNGET
ncbi:hypothetical protein G5I_09130 [Acromyrmex echinatior]|uniref:Uncharacterized protein n=1 Tax=Acromyrmex echinatior TaxID=103372 RepID=F4WTA1_ACREC|nr:hypothetical protein G5I_09130 [Acromyrmex echinatior]